MAIQPFSAANQEHYDIIGNLPDEISTEILSYLDIPSIGNCSQVCRRWNFLTQKDELWTDIAKLTFKATTGSIIPSTAKNSVQNLFSSYVRSNDELLNRIRAFLNKTRLGQNAKFTCILTNQPMLRRAGEKLQVHGHDYAWHEDNRQYNYQFLQLNIELISGEAPHYDLRPIIGDEGVDAERYLITSSSTQFNIRDTYIATYDLDASPATLPEKYHNYHNKPRWYIDDFYLRPYEITRTQKLHESCIYRALARHGLESFYVVLLGRIPIYYIQPFTIAEGIVSHPIIKVKEFASRSSALYCSIQTLVEKKLIAFNLEHEKKRRFWTMTSIAVTAIFSISALLLNRYLATETAKKPKKPRLWLAF
jgi:hypothetical protein